MREKNVATKSVSEVLLLHEKISKSPIGGDVNVEDDDVSDADVNNCDNNLTSTDDSTNKDQPSRVSEDELNSSIN